MCLLVFWTHYAFIINHSHWQKEDDVCFPCLNILPILIPTTSSKTEPCCNTFSNEDPSTTKAYMVFICFLSTSYTWYLFGLLDYEWSKGNREKWKQMRKELVKKKWFVKKKKRNHHGKVHELRSLKARMRNPVSLSGSSCWVLPEPSGSWVPLHLVFHVTWLLKLLQRVGFPDFARVSGLAIGVSSLKQLGWCHYSALLFKYSLNSSCLVWLIGCRP